MADTITTNYHWVKPEISGSPTTWGVKWNSNLDQMDATIFGLAGALALVPIGAIFVWPSFTPPTNYFMCDGSVYNFSDAPLLAAIVGGAFGGNGTTTFAVPDLNGNIILTTTSPSTGYGPIGSLFAGDFATTPISGSDFSYMTMPYIIRYK